METLGDVYRSNDSGANTPRRIGALGSRLVPLANARRTGIKSILVIDGNSGRRIGLFWPTSDFWFRGTGPPENDDSKKNAQRLSSMKQSEYSDKRAMGAWCTPIGMF